MLVVAQNPAEFIVYNTCSQLHIKYNCYFLTATKYVFLLSPRTCLTLTSCFPGFSIYVYSKGTVLDKTVDYLEELVFQNEQLTASAKIAEKSTKALNQILVLEKENAFLRAQIIQFGIDGAASSGQKQPNQQLLNSPLARISPSLTIATLSVLLCIHSFYT